MTYTTASGVVIPQGTDAFSPATQFKTWADKATTYDNYLTVADDTERAALTTPELREGLHCYVKATKVDWFYDGTTWEEILRPGADGIPYRSAQGTLAVPLLASNAVSAGVAVTFPVGRFTVAPLIWFGTESARVNASYGTVTTSGTTATFANWSNATAGASTAMWHAVQMTSSTAAG